MTGTLPQPPTILTARFSEAFEYARAHHTDQLRKGTSIPYLAHLLAVSALVLEHGGDETAAVAALLHDVVEDGGGERALAEIGERFGPASPRSSRAAATPPRTSRRTGRCASAATSSTSRPRSPDVLLVSAADKLHNARAILGDLREHGDELWMRFNRGASEQLWYYGALRDVFLRRLPGRLADELDETVRAIERQIDPEDPA